MTRSKGSAIQPPPDGWGDLGLAQHNVDDNLLYAGGTDRHGKGHVYVGLQPDRLRKAAASRVTT